MESSKGKTAVRNKIVVIGASSGGMRALIQLLSQLSVDFPAPIMIVQHLSPDADSEVLLNTLNRATPLNCIHPVEGDLPAPGYIYLAPADHHLMIGDDGRIKVTKGASENRSRPGIDPLFRSAAVTYDSLVVAVLLTGYLDDGVSGLIAVQRCGGVCIVQDPEDAEYPDMPRNALEQITPDHILPVIRMGAVLLSEVSAKPAKKGVVPEEIQREATIASRVLSDLPSVNALGEQVPFNCPGCGGVLWQVEQGKALRYRCHVGHAYTAASLLAEQNDKIEETMWMALRMFEERRNLLSTLATQQQGAKAEATKERAALSQIHIDRIRSILNTPAF